jgi:regulator of sirC expression with transglutaminase-like and TPR domain
MPVRTCSISAPSRSARLASSFIKLILVASIALAAYLVSSADRTLMTKKPVVVAVERFVQGAQQFGGARIVSTDNDTIGFNKVLYRRAFLEKLRVGHDVELGRHGATVERGTDLRVHGVGGPTGTVDLLTTMR